MKIDLDKIDRTQFLVHEHIVAGEPCYLVHPQHIGAEWTPDNLIFRSSLWNVRGEPVSLSYKKHFNWDEKPEIDPAPRSLEGVELMEKIDGSTLLISKYRDTLIVRTRGTVDATKLDNGDEIALFKQRYPEVFRCPSAYPLEPNRRMTDYTLAFEWVSPRNKIVIDYSEPDIYLTGFIGHSDYGYGSQDALDNMALGMGVKRPRRYRFDTIPQMLEAVSAFQGVEGVCAYYNKGQSWRKIKSVSYLTRHRFKENVTPRNMLDLFFAYSRPDLDVFLARIEQEFDWECRAMATDLAIQISRIHLQIIFQHHQMVEPISSLRSLSRREAAEYIMKHYQGYWKGVAFGILDNKPLDNKTLRNLIEEELEKES